MRLSRWGRGRRPCRLFSFHWAVSLGRFHRLAVPFSRVAVPGGRMEKGTRCPIPAWETIQNANKPPKTAQKRPSELFGEEWKTA